jgi:hypothetical protein
LFEELGSLHVFGLFGLLQVAANDSPTPASTSVGVIFWLFSSRTTNVGPSFHRISNLVRPGL